MSTPVPAPDPLPDLERESELLPKDPPPSVLRITTDVVLGFFLVAAAFIVLVKLPATATGRFVLKPAAGADPVKAPWDGEIDEVAVSLGSVVERGDLLFALRADALRELAAERARLREELQDDAERLASLRGEGENQVRVPLLSRIDRLRRQLELERGLSVERARRHEARQASLRAELESRRRETRQLAARAETLDDLMATMQAARDEGVASGRELLEERAGLESARADLEDARRERGGAESALSLLESERAVELSAEELELARLEGELEEALGELRELRVELSARVAGGEQRLASLERTLSTTVGDRLEVRAPWAGSVVALGVERAGGTVARGDLLCELAPLGGALVARVTLPETEAARVSEGQEVRLLFDAYPYARHGVKTGRLTWVSPTAAGGELIATAELLEAGLRVEGRPVVLRAGLEGEARVRTGRHSLLEYVLEPLREARENLAPEAETP